MDLSEVRVNIDRVDKEIRQRFIERMGLSEQVVSVKAKTADKIYKPDREVEVIKKNSMGVDPEILQEYQSFIKKIMDVSRKYQYGRMLDLRDCFPFSYKKERVDFKKAVILETEKDLVEKDAFEEVFSVKSYEDMAEKIKTKEADCGIIIVDGCNIPSLHTFQKIFSENKWYINQCVVKMVGGTSRKIILFSENFYVLPEHNRCSVVLTCNNQAGGIASVLSMISDYGVNITEIHSYLIKGEKSYDNAYYLEWEGNIDTKDCKTLLFQLSEETDNFQILGSYFYEGEIE